MSRMHDLLMDFGDSDSCFVPVEPPLVRLDMVLWDFASFCSYCRKYRGAGSFVPLEQTAKSFSPKSIPIAWSGSTGW